MNGDAAFHLSYLIGPFGGIVALGFGAGAAGGWTLAIRSVFKLVQQEREQCAREKAVLEARVKEVEDRYLNGMERRIAQIRESSVRVLGRNVTDTQGEG